MLDFSFLFADVLKQKLRPAAQEIAAHKLASSVASKPVNIGADGLVETLAHKLSQADISDDVDALLGDLLPDHQTETAQIMERMQESSVVDPSLEEVDSQLSLLNFLLSKIGANSSDKKLTKNDLDHDLPSLEHNSHTQILQYVNKNFRAEIEAIIQNKDGIFDEFFFRVNTKLKQKGKEFDAIRKKHLDIQNRSKGVLSQGETEARIQNEIAKITRDVREEVLRELGKDYFSKLGAYHADDSFYYFSENQTAKALSQHFIDSLYGNHELAEKMLQAQKDKTDGQAEYIEAEIEKLLPRSFYHVTEDLACVSDSLDLFLISPSIWSIAQVRKPAFYKRWNEFHPTVSRAGVLADSMPEIVRKSEEISASSNKMQSNIAQSSHADSASSSESIRKEQVAVEKAHKWVADRIKSLKEKLASFPAEQTSNLLTSIEAIELYDHPAEKVFVFQRFILGRIEALLNHKIEYLNERKLALSGEINQRQKEITENLLKVANRKELISKLLSLVEKEPKIKTIIPIIEANNTVSDSNAFRPILRKDMPILLKALEEMINADSTINGLQGQLATCSEALAEAHSELDNNINFKARFMKLFYPHIIPVAKSLKEAHADKSKQESDLDKFKEKGGVYSCLSFIPVKISQVGEADRFECLVALSGVEMDNDKVNPHQLLKEFAESLPQLNGFAFRYVGPSADNLNFLLMQIGKGLSGSEHALSTLRQGDLMPAFDKTCAEKRLVTELMSLYARYGQQVQVLGCDNIALPTAGQVANQQQLLASKAEEKEFDIHARILNAKKEVDKVTLRGAHITCCSDCFKQKSAVMTVLFDTMKRSEDFRRQQGEILARCQLAPHAVSSSNCRDEARKSSNSSLLLRTERGQVFQ